MECTNKALSYEVLLDLFVKLNILPTLKHPIFNIPFLDLVYKIPSNFSKYELSTYQISYRLDIQLESYARTKYLAKSPKLTLSSCSLRSLRLPDQ